MKRMRKADLKEAWELLGGKCWFCGQTLHPFADWGATMHDGKPIPECSDCRRMRRGRSVEDFRDESYSSITRAAALLEWAAARRRDLKVKAMLKQALDNLFGDYGQDFPFYGELQLEDTPHEGSDGPAGESGD